MVNRHFHPTKGSNSCKSEPLKLVHSDVCGPMLVSPGTSAQSGCLGARARLPARSFDAGK